jgi:hypothetical protein
MTTSNPTACSTAARGNGSRSAGWPAVVEVVPHSGTGTPFSLDPSIEENVPLFHVRLIGRIDPLVASMLDEEPLV